MQEMFNKDLEERKNKQTEMNNTITEMKNTLEGINRRITEAEERISDLEDRMVEFTASSPLSNQCCVGSMQSSVEIREGREAKKEKHANPFVTNTLESSSAFCA